MGQGILHKWYFVCNDKNNRNRIPKFINSTKNNSVTQDNGSTSLPPIGTSFLYKKSSGGNYGSNNVFCSFQRTD